MLVFRCCTGVGVPLMSHMFSPAVQSKPTGSGRESLLLSVLSFLTMSPLPVFPDLLSAVPAGLHATVIFFCGGVILFSSVACGFFFFNAFGRPYETLHGPTGLYLWTSISCETRNTMTSQIRAHTHRCTSPDRMTRGRVSGCAPLPEDALLLLLAPPSGQH